MGLAGTKNKQKWGKDPNNTHWANNSMTFGQKMLRSQGWEPGSYLGAKDASHAAHFTAASASHVRVTLKDDTLGLGAKKNQGDECVGLDAFQQLLSRLNGASGESIQAEKTRVEAVERSRYVARKLGTMNFVRGGFLVGDSMQTAKPAAKTAADLEKSKDATSSDSDSASDHRETATKRRKVEPAEVLVVKDRGAKASKKDRKKNKAEIAGGEDGEGKEKKKMEKKKSRKADLVDGPAVKSETATAEQTGKAANEVVAATLLSRQSASLDEISELNGQDMTTDRRKGEKKKKKHRKTEEQRDETVATEPQLFVAEHVLTPQSATPLSASGTSTPTTGALSSRHRSRSRFIAQKQMAVLDPAALNQIFMIKS